VDSLADLTEGGGEVDMSRTHIVFDEISVNGTRYYSDPATGKRRRETRKFFQTVNPFNIDKTTGEIKTREQIWKEICREKDRWLEGLPDRPPEIP
jgi:hypothetical protein